jgi:alcohol dehydrogenase
VGTVAVQLATHVLRAATVATTCSGGDKAELLRSLGADVVVDYKKAKFWEQLQDYDAAFDTTGESAKCVLAVRRGGKVVTIDATMTEAIGIANIFSNDCSRSKRLSYSRPGRVGRRIAVTGIFTL